MCFTKKSTQTSHSTTIHILQHAAVKGYSDKKKKRFSTSEYYDFANILLSVNLQ